MSAVTFWYATKGSAVEHSTNAPLFAVKPFERGFYPVYSVASAADLNKDTPADVLESALHASCFGWHIPAARVAVDHVQAREKALALAVHS